MTYKQVRMVEKRRHHVNAPHLVDQVQAGVKFLDGVSVESQEVNDDARAT